MSYVIVISSLWLSVHLKLARFVRNRQWLKTLLTTFVDVSMPNRTSLHKAAEAGTASTVQRLLWLGESPNSHGSCWRTPLHLAAGEPRCTWQQKGTQESFSYYSSNLTKQILMPMKMARPSSCNLQRAPELCPNVGFQRDTY